MKIRYGLLMLLLVFLVGVVGAVEDTLGPEFTVNIKPEGNEVRVYGEARDIAPSNSTPSGLSRVEIKLDSDSWITADLSGNSWEKKFNLDYSGTHVVQVRAIDNNYHTSMQVVSFRVNFDDSSSERLERYFRIRDLDLQTLQQPYNVRTIGLGEDIWVSFEIESSYSEDRELSYIITINREEIEDDVLVPAGDDEDVTEGVSSWYLVEGQNRIEIEVMDWETGQTVAEKDLTISVDPDLKLEEKNKGVSSEVLSSSDDIPEWFLRAAEMNDWRLPSDSSQDVEELNERIEELNETLLEQDKKISFLEGELNNPRSSSQVVQPVTQAEVVSVSEGNGQWVSGIDNIWVFFVLLGILGYLWYYKKGPFAKFSSSGDNDLDLPSVPSTSSMR